MNWRCAPRILNCVPMRFYLMIPACGRRYSLLAVEPGEVVFTIPIKLSTSLTPVKKRSDCSKIIIIRLRDLFRGRIFLARYLLFFSLIPIKMLITKAKYHNS